MRYGRLGLALLVAAFALASPPAVAQNPPAPALTRDEMRSFLRTARIVRWRDTGKGVTRPVRLTLSDGRLTHDAVFQSIDEQSTVANLRGAKGSSVELGFVDSYRYNLAAEAVATLVGLDHMMPVHVERRWNARVGSLSWFVDTLMDEGERLKAGVKPPDAEGWNRQMYRMRVFAALVRDTDRNLGNVLITPDWRVMMIDFTRAFRLHDTLPTPEDLNRCDRDLLARLPSLSKAGIKAAVRDDLTPGEIDALLKRRDRLVAHFARLVAERGEAGVLY